VAWARAVLRRLAGRAEAWAIFAQRQFSQESFFFHPLNSNIERELKLGIVLSFSCA